MSRRNERYRRRLARHEQFVAEFQSARQDPEAMVKLLPRIAASTHCVWPIAQEAAARAKQPLDAAEQAMIAQTIHPALAGTTPGTVRKCHDLSGMSNKEAWLAARRHRVIGLDPPHGRA